MAKSQKLQDLARLGVQIVDTADADDAHQTRRLWHVVVAEIAGLARQAGLLGGDILVLYFVGGGILEGRLARRRARRLRGRLRLRGLRGPLGLGGSPLGGSF